MKGIIIKALQRRARKAIRKHQPTIVAVTGSIGKTSAKQAIEVVLKDSIDLRTAKKNFNNEIGVPLAILGEESPGKSVLGWAKLLLKSVPSKFPSVLLLEFGADHPGDIQALCDLAPPTIGIITGISPVHAEFFPDIDALANEKAKLIERLPENGLAILNADDDRVFAMASKASCSTVTYGMKSSAISMANLRIAGRVDESFEPGERFATTYADVRISGSVVGEFQLKNMVGYAPAMAALAALAVSSRFQINPADAIERLNQHFGPTPGRLRPLAGIKGSLVIDDSYNAAPAAMQNGLDILKIFTPGDQTDRRIAVLGSMAELGQYNEDEHRLIGLKVAEVADLFIAVGDGMRFAVEAAKEAGMDEDAIEWFMDSDEAGRYLDRTIRQGDIIYVKGSQSSRMEKVVKDIMAEPLRAKELLVRQEDKWLVS
jgi:UDP-N-acetylmuramyl pentapeptide synthase